MYGNMYGNMYGIHKGLHSNTSIYHLVNVNEINKY